MEINFYTCFSRDKVHDLIMKYYTAKTVQFDAVLIWLMDKYFKGNIGGFDCK